MNIQHSSRLDSWQTPDEVLILVREVLGTIDLDPASSVEANERIGALRIFTEHTDGLESSWELANETVYCNPPSGKIGRNSKTGLFWRKLIREKYLGNLAHAIFMAFSIEQLQSSQNKGTPSLGHFPFCVPAKRIAFVHPSENKQSPSHSNLIVYVPGTVDKSYKFKEVFSSLGIVIGVK